MFVTIVAGNQNDTFSIATTRYRGKHYSQPFDSCTFVKKINCDGYFFISENCQHNRLY